MTRICLDTSGYSRFMRGDADVVELVSQAGTVLVPTVVLGELRAGFALGTQRARNQRELAAFLAHPAVRVLDVDDEAATIFAELFTDQRFAGVPVPTNDLWIAALAIREGAVVVTYDAHFQAIARVRCRVLGNP